jgi:phage tail-like protein
MSATQNPYETYNFMVAIDNVPAASFTECILPTVSLDVVEYRQGSDEVNNVHKLPGLVRYGNLTLRRGISSSLALWNWVNAFVEGTGNMEAVTVKLLDAKRDPVIEWKFTNCWPVKYELPVLSGHTSALAIESIEIAVDSMAMTVTGSP